MRWFISKKGVPAMSTPGFTSQQRMWIIHRDASKCALCEAASSLHVHHIVPKRWAREVLGWSLAQINAPENGITLCERCHIGKSPHCIHPDALWAKQTYWRNRQSFHDMQSWRDMLCRRRVPYWNTEFDERFLSEARERTRVYRIICAPTPPW